jgi:gamma-glutamylcysteine synthetase
MLAAPSAIQAGLLRNAANTWRFLSRFPWSVLGELRLEGARRGLAGEVSGTRVRRFASQVLELAAEGLRPEELPLLAYPESVLRSGKSGADRALDLYDRYRNLPRVVRELTLTV